MSNRLYDIKAKGDIRVHLRVQLDSSRRCVRPGLLLGVLGTKSEPEPFVISKDMELHMGSDTGSLYRMEFPDQPLVPGASLTFTDLRITNRVATRTAAVTAVEPVAPEGCKVLRVVTKYLAEPDDEDPAQPLNFDIVVDADNRRVRPDLTLGWEGFPTDPECRWPFLVTSKDVMDFGIHTGLHWGRTRRLELPNEIKVGAVIRMEEDDYRNAYRITFVG